MFVKYERFHVERIVLIDDDANAVFVGMVVNGQIGKFLFVHFGFDVKERLFVRFKLFCRVSVCDVDHKNSFAVMPQLEFV